MLLYLPNSPWAAELAYEAMSYAIWLKFIKVIADPLLQTYSITHQCAAKGLQRSRWKGRFRMSTLALNSLSLIEAST